MKQEIIACLAATATVLAAAATGYILAIASQAM